jgi:DNA polymerase III subunit epsilon
VTSNTVFNHRLESKDAVSLRQIFLDTETTGLLADDGHRIIEIGCIEMVNRRLTGANLHLYLNPEREIDAAASEVHGMTWDQLTDKPLFADVADEFLDFVAGSELIIHNANFDMGFLEAELSRSNRPALRPRLANVIDTYQMAKVLHPGKRKSLDALCERYGIGNAHRTHHGALLDAGLLAEVYLAMTRGQETIAIDVDADRSGLIGRLDWPPRVIPITISSEEMIAHDLVLDMIAKETRKPPLWRQ